MKSNSVKQITVKTKESGEVEISIPESIILKDSDFVGIEENEKQKSKNSVTVFASIFVSSFPSKFGNYKINPKIHFTRNGQKDYSVKNFMKGNKKKLNILTDYYCRRENPFKNFKIRGFEDTKQNTIFVVKKKNITQNTLESMKDPIRMENKELEMQVFTLQQQNAILINEKNNLLQQNAILINEKNNLQQQNATLINEKNEIDQQYQAFVNNLCIHVLLSQNQKGLQEEENLVISFVKQTILSKGVKNGIFIYCQKNKKDYPFQFGIFVSDLTFLSFLLD